MKNEKAVRYETDWKQHYGRFILGYALIPFLGLGFWILSRWKRELQGSATKIYNDRIEHPSGTIYISTLESVRLEATEKQRKRNLSDVIISSDSKSIRIIGIKKQEADQLEDALLIAIQAEKDRKQMSKRVKNSHSDKLKIGALEHMNSLVGLWQQGLISEEDFEKEQNKFKK